MHQQPVPEQRQASGVAWYRVVVEVALHDRFEPLTGLGQGIVHTLVELRLNASKLSPHALSDRLPPYCKPAQAVLPTDVGEAQEIERLRFPFPPTFPVLFGLLPSASLLLLLPGRQIRSNLSCKECLTTNF